MIFLGTNMSVEKAKRRSPKAFRRTQENHCYYK